MAIWSLRSRLWKGYWEKRAESAISCPAYLLRALGQESGYMASVVQAWSCLLATAYNRNDFQYSESHSVRVLTAPLPLPTFSPWRGPRFYASEELEVGRECFSCMKSQKHEIRQERSPRPGQGGPSVPVHALLGSRMKTSMPSMWGFAVVRETLTRLHAEGQTQL